MAAFVSCWQKVERAREKFISLRGLGAAMGGHPSKTAQRALRHAPFSYVNDLKTKLQLPKYSVTTVQKAL